MWKHGDDVAVAASMTGDAPALTYAYDPAAAAFTKDTYVKVTVTSDKDTATTKISDAVTFVHTKDTVFPGCSFDPAQGQFIVHINVFDLTIVKSAKTGTTIDPNQTFVFKVKNNDNGKTMEIVITGEGQKTVKSLPMGSYTITEKGRKVAQELAYDLPRSVRERAVAAVLRCQTWARKEAKYSASITEKEDGHCTIRCTVKGLDSELFCLDLGTPDRLTAELVKKQFILKGNEIYQMLINKLTEEEK